jgi:hypothetical protein
MGEIRWHMGLRIIRKIDSRRAFLYHVKSIGDFKR